MTARGTGWTRILWPGQSVHVRVAATSPVGLANAAPERFTLDGRTCRPW